MKFLNYIYNNSMTFGGLLRRFFVLTLGLALIFAVSGYIRLMSYIGSSSMISDLKTPESVQNISNISDFFSGSNYIKYTSSEGFTTNKTGVLYKDGDSTIEVNVSGDANRRYAGDKKGLGITNKYIYINSNDTRTQTIPRQTIMKLFVNTGSVSGVSNIYIDSLFTGTNIISGDVFYIGSRDGNRLAENINSTLQNPEFYTKAKSDIGSLLIILSIPLIIAFFVFLIILLVIYIFIFTFYVLISWAIGSIMGSVGGFSRAVSISRIPFIIKEILQITLGFDFIITAVIYILMIFGIIYYNTKMKITEKIEQIKEIE